MAKDYKELPDYVELIVDGKPFIYLMGNYNDNPEEILSAKEDEAKRVKAERVKVKKIKSNQDMLEEVLLRAGKQLPPHRIFNR